MCLYVGYEVLTAMLAANNRGYCVSTSCLHAGLLLRLLLDLEDGGEKFLRNFG
jgi:hypothetical protein